MPGREVGPLTLGGSGRLGSGNRITNRSQTGQAPETGHLMGRKCLLFQVDFIFSKELALVGVEPTPN